MFHVLYAWQKEHPDVLLFIECGYKYRFFGHGMCWVAVRALHISHHIHVALDALVAAKVLGIWAHQVCLRCCKRRVTILTTVLTPQSHNFLTASVPVHRVGVHVRRYASYPCGDSTLPVAQ